jgi:hypothetical protein
MARALPAVVLVGALAALTAALSCKTFDLPAETCNPAGLFTPVPDDAGTADTRCGRCLEDHCCDLVGVCGQKAGCADTVNHVQGCVLGAGLRGARDEASCATKSDLAGQPEANDVYRCMRDSCGSQCGLPVCQVEKAAVLIHNAKCDQCFSGSCCRQLNACYGSRACKLMIECIDRECGDELGTSLKTLSLGSDEAHLCAAATAPPDFHGPECVRRCMCRYKDNDQGLPPVGAPRPFALAGEVYGCGAVAGCGDDCLGGRDEAGP